MSPSHGPPLPLAASPRPSGEGGFSPEALERAIDGAVLRLHTSPTVEGRREAWAELVRLHEMRSPETVERMERERGLSCK